MERRDSSRRAFLHHSLTAAAATAVLGHLASPADLFDAETRTPAGV